MNGKDLTAISTKEFEARQQVLDVEKWLESERVGYDLCGSMDYCGNCVKAEAYPCAKAEFRKKMQVALDEVSQESDEICESTEEALTETAIEEVAEKEIANKSGQDVGKVGYEFVTILRRTFRSRLIQNLRAQDLYTELKNLLLTFSAVKSRMTQSGENFRVSGQKIAKINISGKTLCLYLALDPEEYISGKYRFSNVSDKKVYAETPMKLRVTGSRSLKHAKELIEVLAHKNELTQSSSIYYDYHCRYRTDEELIAAGEIKVYTVERKKRKKED